jgi:hypothetical protein
VWNEVQHFGTVRGKLDKFSTFGAKRHSGSPPQPTQAKTRLAWATRPNAGAIYPKRHRDTVLTGPGTDGLA